jgi:hypothetical protein
VESICPNFKEKKIDKKSKKHGKNEIKTYKNNKKLD